MRAFCGVGNPFSLGAVAEGWAVLDVACGAGFDCFVASQRVGAGGRVEGIDITPGWDLLKLVGHDRALLDVLVEQLGFIRDLGAAGRVAQTHVIARRAS